VGHKAIIGMGGARRSDCRAAGWQGARSWWGRVWWISSDWAAAVN